MNDVLNDGIYGSLVDGRYRVKKSIGSGAMSHVYLAQDEQSEQLVALKVLRDNSNAQLVSRLLREFKACSALKHPNIVKMIGYGIAAEDDSPYVAMEYLPYPSLEEVLEDVERLAQSQVCTLIEQLSKACAHCHEHQIIHRDIKPANIILTSDGRAVLVDFGIALARDMTALTGTGEMLGTPFYMSPEVFDGKQATIKSDLYALGTVCYRLLTGRIPFEGDSLAEFIGNMMIGQYPKPNVILPSLHEGWNEILSLCLAAEPQARYEDMETFNKALAQLRAKLDVEKPFARVEKPEGQKLIAGRYRLGQELGRGSMAVIYQAVDERANQDVAIKFIAPHLLDDTEAKQRFERERKACAKFAHPNVATLLDRSPPHCHEPYYVMEYAKGKSLATIIGDKGAIAPRKVKSIVTDLAKALRAIHELGIIHRDVKPANVIIREDGSAMLIDFGLALLKEATTITRTGKVVGSPYYIAPEIAVGNEATAAADVYSLGVLIYNMLTGEQPFAGATMESLLIQILGSHYRPINEVKEGIPPFWEQFIEKALARDLETRFKNMDEVLAFLQGRRKPLKARAPFSSTVSTKVEGQSKRRNRLLPLVTSIFILLAAFYFFCFSGQQSQSEDAEEHLKKLQQHFSGFSIDSNKASINSFLQESAIHLANLRKQGYGLDKTLKSLQQQQLPTFLISAAKAATLALESANGREAFECYKRALDELREAAVGRNLKKNLSQNLRLEVDLIAGLFRNELFEKYNDDLAWLPIQSLLFASRLQKFGLSQEDFYAHRLAIFRLFNPQSTMLSETSLLQRVNSLSKESKVLLAELDKQRILGLKNKSRYKELWQKLTMVFSREGWGTYLVLSKRETTVLQRRKLLARLRDFYADSDQLDSHRAILGPLKLGRGLSRHNISYYCVTEVLNLRHIACHNSLEESAVESSIAYSREGKNFIKDCVKYDFFNDGAGTALCKFLENDKKRLIEDDYLLVLAKGNQRREFRSVFSRAKGLLLRIDEDNPLANRHYARLLSIYDGLLPKMEKLELLGSCTDILDETIKTVDELKEKSNRIPAARCLRAIALAHRLLIARSTKELARKTVLERRLKELLKNDRQSRRALKKFTQRHSI